MGNKWIIDVLADLQAFAEQNDLHIVADHLAETAKIARIEIASITQGAPRLVCGDRFEAGKLYQAIGEGRRS